MDATEFAGRTVVITGGVSGIGRGVAAGLVERGVHVVVLDREQPTDDQMLAGVDYVRGDVTDPQANEAAVQVALDHYRRLDAFVGNAGIHDGGARLLDLTPTQLDVLSRRLLDVNVRGYLHGARAAAPGVRQARGTMVFTLSDAAFKISGVGSGICYTVSKHAALGVVRALAAELAPEVRVNAVAPGGILTGLRAADSIQSRTRKLFINPGELEAQVKAINPLGVMLRVEELVPHYLFLLSSLSAGLTGHVLRPDGGLSVA